MRSKAPNRVGQGHRMQQTSWCQDPAMKAAQRASCWSNVEPRHEGGLSKKIKQEMRAGTCSCNSVDLPNLKSFAEATCEEGTVVEQLQIQKEAGYWRGLSNLRRLTVESALLYPAQKQAVEQVFCQPRPAGSAKLETDDCPPPYPAVSASTVLQYFAN